MPDTLQPGNHIKFLVAVVHINWYSIRFGKSIESTISEIDKTLLRENNNQESIQKHTTNVLIILGGIEGGNHEAHYTRHSYVWCSYV